MEKAMPEPSTRDIQFKGALRLAALLFAMLAIVIAVVVGLVRHWHLQSSTRVTDKTLALRPAGHLETAPQPALADYLKAKNALIDSYAWIDEKNGVARIPITVAMHAMVARQEQSKGAAKP
jgi:hypothetical protein